MELLCALTESGKICLGAQSIEHANILSEKNHFSALAGPKVAIFGRDDLDPLHFDVSNISVPPDPPICLNMPKCAISSTFWESRLKQTSKVGVHPNNFFIGNVAKHFSRAFYIYVEMQA